MSAAEDTANGWTEEQEALLIAWAEKASGYAWLHNKSKSLYKHRNLCLSIPAALMAYIAASTTLLATQGENDGWRTYVAGLGSLFAGMLVNFQEVFTFKELAEQHRLSQLGFMAFFRDISCELSVPKLQRKEASEYVTMKRLEMDKMLEHAPDIPPQLVREFDERFADVRMHKPDVVSRLQTVVPHLSPLPGGGREQDPHTRSRTRPLKLEFRPGRDLVVPWEARTDVSDLVEVANSDSGSDHESGADADVETSVRSSPSVPADSESSLVSSEQHGQHRSERGVETVL